MYRINEVALMSGLSTRTLRSYLKSGILDGEKVDGVWQFSAEQVEAFMAYPEVRRAIQSRRNALVFDFMGDTYKKENSLCVILDLPVDDEEAEEAMQFFCEAVTRHEGEGKLKMGYSRQNGLARIIVTGDEECVLQVMRAYYD